MHLKSGYKASQRMFRKLSGCYRSSCAAMSVCTSAVERVYTLPAFGVDQLPDQEKPPGECESLDRGGLGLQVELGPALGYWQRLVGGSITA
jgi:hypothetical protein